MKFQAGGSSNFGSFMWASTVHGMLAVTLREAKVKIQLQPVSKCFKSQDIATQSLEFSSMEGAIWSRQSHIATIDIRSLTSMRPEEKSSKFLVSMKYVCDKLIKASNNSPLFDETNLVFFCLLL